MEKSSKDMTNSFPLDEPCLIINMRNLSHIKSWFAREHPNYVEGCFMDKKTVIKRELKMGFGRIKRIISNIRLIIRNLDDVFHFKYPRFSYFALILSFLFGLFGDLNNILSYITFLIIVIIIYQYPEVKFRIDKILEKYFLNDKLINKDYVIPQIEKISSFESKKCADINRLRMKIKDTESILTKYRAMKKSIAKMQFFIMTICNFFEKIKNLANWSDPQKNILFSYRCFYSLCLFFNFNYKNIHITWNFR